MIPPKCAVIGIDAAWTLTKPSGVCLLTRTGSTWSYRAVAPSYEEFISVLEGGRPDWNHINLRKRNKSVRDVISAAQKFVSPQPIRVVAVDMPLANQLITGRRYCDDAISKEFGAQQCGTHSPTRLRPAQVGLDMMNDLLDEDYALAVTDNVPRSSKHLIEVYPHPAVVQLLSLDKRLPYKVGKSTKYWPGTSIDHRIRKLLENFRLILKALDQEFSKISDFLPNSTTTLTSLKPYEDAVDAMVCAWVAMKFLEGNAEAFGNLASAIWVPR